MYLRGVPNKGMENKLFHCVPNKAKYGTKVM
jgi:hypothetical protein